MWNISALFKLFSFHNIKQCSWKKAIDKVNYFGRNRVYIRRLLCVHFSSFNIATSSSAATHRYLQKEGILFFTSHHHIGQHLQWEISIHHSETSWSGEEKKEKATSGFKQRSGHAATAQRRRKKKIVFITRIMCLRFLLRRVLFFCFNHILEGGLWGDKVLKRHPNEGRRPEEERESISRLRAARGERGNKSRRQPSLRGWGKRRSNNTTVKYGEK